MQMIPPNTLRVIVPKGTKLYHVKNYTARVVLAVDQAVDIEINYAGIEELARRACGNKTKRATDGPLTAEPLGQVMTEEVPVEKF